MRDTYTIIGLTRRGFFTYNLVCISIILMASHLSNLSQCIGQYPEIWHLVAMPGSQTVCARNPTYNPLILRILHDYEGIDPLRGAEILM